MRRTTSPPADPSSFFEPLEPRTLLAGFTLVTHGFSLDGNYPGWVPAMSAAIADRAGTPGVDVSQYRLSLLDDGSQNPSKLSGPTLAQATTGEAILGLDWAELSNNFDFFADDSSGRADIVAGLAVNWLLSPFGLGVDNPLVELPIQLVGHSRGASVISQIAKLLASHGIWVDEMTPLDPHPLTLADPFVDPDEVDPAVLAYENTVFVDNYWRTDGGGGDLDGESIQYAHNLQLNEGTLSNGGYGYLDGGQHSDVHLWYHGTIDTSGNANDGSQSVPSGWYQGNMGPRTQNGFYFSRIGGGAAQRPSDGISSLFGGSAGRNSVNRVGAQWPNVINLALDDYSVTVGQIVKATFKYGDYDSGGTTTLYLDNDQNPYDGNSGLIGSQNYNATGSGVYSGQYNWNTAGLADKAGHDYYVYAKITDGGRTRYAYATSKVTLQLGPLLVTALPNPAGIGQTITITASNVTDPDGVSKVSFILDWNGNKQWDNGIDLTLGAAVKQGNGLDWVLQNRSVGSLWGTGPTIIIAQITDGLGHVDRSHYGTLAVENGGPRLTSESATPNPVKLGGTLSLSAHAQDDVSVSKVTFYYDGDRNGTWTNGTRPDGKAIDWALGPATYQGNGLWVLNKTLDYYWDSEVGADRRFIAQAFDNQGNASVRQLGTWPGVAALYVSVRIDPPQRPGGQPPALQWEVAERSGPGPLRSSDPWGGGPIPDLMKPIDPAQKMPAPDPTGIVPSDFLANDFGEGIVNPSLLWGRMHTRLLLRPT